MKSFFYGVDHAEFLKGFSINQSESPPLDSAEFLLLNLHKILSKQQNPRIWLWSKGSRGMALERMILPLGPP
jgi:hypothetical protein